MTALLWLSLPARAGGLSGDVTDLEGEPLAGVTIYAYDLRLGYATATSTNDGSWAMEGLPAGAWRIRAVPTGPHVARFWPDAWSYCEADVVQITEDEAAEGLDLSLPVGGALVGRVVDPDGDPVGGLDVECDGVDARTSGLRYGAETDADGAYRIEGIDAGESGSRYAIAVGGGDWPDQFIGGGYEEGDADHYVVALGEEGEAAEASLLEGVAMRGWVEDEDGAPIVGGSLHAYASSQVVSVDIQEDGAFEALGLPPGEGLVWASVDGYGLTYYPDHDRPTETIPDPGEGGAAEGLVLTLPEEARFNGRVLGEGDLSGVTVLAFNDENTVGIGDGVEADGAFSLGRLHGGDYTLYVYAEDEGYLDDYARGDDGEIRVFSLGDGEDSPVYEIPLRVGGAIAGTILDDAGAPVYGAYVYASPVDSALNTEVAVTAADGTYEIDGLVAESWQLEIYYSRYCEQDPGYVRLWWPGEVDEGRATRIALGDGDRLGGVDLILPVDTDNDGMGDAWEEAHGLDVGRDDADEDLDGDGYTNLEEYLLGTDPSEDLRAAAAGCGCGGGAPRPFALAGLAGLAALTLRRRRV